MGKYILDGWEGGGAEEREGGQRKRERERMKYNDCVLLLLTIPIFLPSPSIHILTSSTGN